MVADRRKRSKLAGKGEGVDFGHVDEKLVGHIEKLQEVQDELEKVNEEATDKVLEVEQEYSEICRPIYSRRNAVIQLIPDFWITAILSHPVLADLITENDQKILKYLVSVDVDDFKDLKSGYSITFSFLPNPYFEDEKLMKTITFTDEGTASVTGTTIKWKKGMDISNGSAHETDGTKRPFEEESVFNWFNETRQKNFSDGLGDEVAEIIKEDLWPNPLKYFNNEADEEDFDGKDDDEDKGTEDEEEDDDEDDEDDADEHDEDAEDD